MKTIAINNDAMQNLHILLKEMKSKTKTRIFGNGCCFATTYCTGGILKDNNNAIYGSALNNSASTARLNNKDYIIDNITGKVKAEKPSLRERIFGISNKTLNTITETINRVKEHFNNNEIVEQWSWGIQGVTEKGAKRIVEAQTRIKKGG